MKENNTTSSSRQFSTILNLAEDELLELIRNWQDFKKEEVLSLYDFILSQSPLIDSGLELFDCCGTGGDEANTFNISTTSAIIAAAMDIKVCKNGGRSSTSKVGSVDVLEELGFDFSKSLDKKIDLLKCFNLSFISSPVSAKLMAPIKQISRKYKIPSILSLVGPLTNPLKLQAQVIGVGKPEWLNLMIEVCKELLCRKASQRMILVHSQSYDSKHRLDELSTATKSTIIDISQNGMQEFDFRVKDLDLQETDLKCLEGGNNQENARLAQEIIFNSGKGEAFEARFNTCCLNAALLSYAKNHNLASYDSFLEKLNNEFKRAKQAIYSGQVGKNWQTLLSS